MPPRERLRDQGLLERQRIQARIMSDVGLGGRVKVGATGGGTQAAGLVAAAPGTVNAQTVIHHATLHATSSQTIAAGGAAVTWDRLAGAPTELRGFSTLLDDLGTNGSVAAIDCDLTGRLQLILELEFQDSSTGTPLDTSGVDCTLTIERVRDGVVITMPDLLDDTDLIGITGVITGWVRNGDVLNIKLDTSADIKLDGIVVADIDGTASPTSSLSAWEQVHVGDATGIVFDGTHWWVAEGDSGRTVFKYDTSWTLAASYEIDVDKPRVSGLTFDGTDLWITGDDPPTGGGADYVHRHSTVDGSHLSQFEVPDAQVSGITFDGTDLWIACNIAETVRRYNLSGVHQETVSLPGGDVFGLAYRSGLFYVARGTSTIDVRDSSWGLIDTVDVSGATASAVGVFVSSDGGLYVTEDGVGVWRRRSG